MRTLFTEYLWQSYEDNTIDKSLFDTRRLREQIVKKLKKSIKIVEIGNKLVVAPFNCKLVPKVKEVDEEEILFNAAMILHNQSKSIQQKPLVTNLTSQKVIEGECEIPPKIVNFCQNVIAGCNFRRKNSKITKRLAKSFSSDIVFATSNGKIKPSKHVNLGLTMKGMTNNKKLLRISNRYGHTCSYDVLTSIESEAAYNISKSKTMCPPELKRKPGLRTILSFDNFNRFIETSRKQVTMDDTVGIAIQDLDDKDENVESDSENEVSDNEISENEVSEAEAEDLQGKKRRRSFKGIVKTVEPYFKKPKITDTFKPFEHDSRNIVPENLNTIQLYDRAWMLSHFLGEPTPMWVGWNAKTYVDTHKKQHISYLPSINENPTEHPVILEKMRIAMTFAEECQEEYAQVSYDLAIAAKAFQLQSEERPKFDKLFIHLGGFHIQAALFKALGHFIEGCGLEIILVEAELIGTGSLATFRTGKHFNRCKRLHVIAALGLEMLEFGLFLESSNIEIDDTSLISFIFY